MKDFFDKNSDKMLSYAGIMSIMQFIGQLRDFLADGKLADHEIQQLLLSASSLTQSVIIVIVAVYFRFIREKRKK